MEDSLVSVLENRPEDCEILVVLNQAYDDPYDLEEEVRFLQVPKKTDLVEAVNSGIAASRAEVVHVLPCGIQACEDWCDAALARFDDPHVAAVNPLLLDAENRRRTISAGATYQRWGRVRRLRKHRASNAQVDILPDPEYAAAFYRKSALEQVGPLSSAFGRGLAPVALGLALQDAGFHCVLESHCRMLAHKTRATRDSAMARGWASERLFWRRLPAKGRSKWLAMHALLVAAQTTGGLVRPSCFLELIGRVAALAAEPFRPTARRCKKPVEQGEPLKGPHFHKTGARRPQTQQSGSV